MVGHVGEGVTRGAIVGGGLEAALAEADATPSPRIDVEAEVPATVDESKPEPLREGRTSQVAGVALVAGEDEVGRLPGVVLEVVPPELGDEAEKISQGCCELC